MICVEQLLIVEDDKALNWGLCEALKVDKRRIISCQDLKTAREQLLCDRVSLVLLDINLPDGSGLNLLREIKERTPDIPVILLTANDKDMDIVDGLEQGADDYITKPFSLSVLRARINTQLRKHMSIHNKAPIHIDHFCFDFSMYHHWTERGFIFTVGKSVQSACGNRKYLSGIPAFLYDYGIVLLLWTLGVDGLAHRMCVVSD